MNHKLVLMKDLLMKYLLNDRKRIYAILFTIKHNPKKGKQMTQENQQHTICAIEYISEKEYNELTKLQELCFDADKINLKLELKHKLFTSNNAKANAVKAAEQATQNKSEKEKDELNPSCTNHINEFLYYVDNTLVAYIGISCFGGNIGEINGMTHPNWRRQGIFHQLFDLVIEECKKRNYSKILLLTDGKSEAGITFIQAVGGIYDFSEYRMKLLKYPTLEDTTPITLRIAGKQDKKKIAELNNLFFYDEEAVLDENNMESNNDKNLESVDGNLAILEEEGIEEDPNTTVFMVELAGEVIGKIHVEDGDNSAFICGFGILPDYRGKGYGRAALKETLSLIEVKYIVDVSLDVVCTNKTALNLYIGCGFEQQSIMNYYQYPMEG